MERKNVGRLGRAGDLPGVSDGGPWQLLRGVQEESVLDSKALNRLNTQILKFVSEGMSREQFLIGINGFSEDFLRLMKDIGDLTRTLSEDARHWIVSSTIDGLKWPLEILRPDTSGGLATRGVLTRRIREYRPPRELRHPFRELFADLRERKRKFRVLLVSSNTGGLPDARAEIEDIEKRLRESCEALKLELEPKTLIDPVELELKEALSDQQPWHLFHFCGHGKHGRNTSALLLRDSTGEITEVRGETLQQWLQGVGLWLCFLNTCSAGAVSGSLNDDEILSLGLVESVLAAGVPTFAGFRCAVTAASSRALAIEFYKELLEPPTGSDPSLAMYRARKAVAGSQECPIDAAMSSILVSQYVE